MPKCPHCHQVIDCTGLSGVVECPYCKKRFNCTPTRTTPPIVPPLPEPIAIEPEEPQFVQELPVSTSRRFMNQKKKPQSLWEFIDLGFQHYLTPIIIKVIWALCLLLAGLGVAYSGFSMITSMFPESSHSTASTRGWDSPPAFTPSAPMSAFENKSTILVLKIVGWLVLVVVTAIWLLILRVICESIIVLFNIAESLVSIDKKTKAA